MQPISPDNQQSNTRGNRSEIYKSNSQKTLGSSPAYRTELPEAKILRVSVSVRCDRQQAFEVWRNFRNLPLFMTDISSVEVISESRSHWIIDLPRGPKMEWDAEIIAEREGEMIAWESLDNPRIHQSGTIQFQDNRRGEGTLISLSLSYELLGGDLAELAATLMLEDPKTLVLQNLRRFKAFLETGEIPTTKGQPSGREEDLEIQTH